MAVNTANLVNFKQGLLANLPLDIKNGTLYFTTDEGAIYLDTNDARVRFGDIVTVANVASLPSAGHAYESALYYAKAENVLARWDKSGNKWIQINAAGLTSLNTATGDGNVITSISVDANGKVTPNKGMTAASTAELNAVKNLVGSSSVDSRLETLRAALQANIDAVDALADQGIANAAAAQKTADDAAAQASTNKADIATNLESINGLKNLVGSTSVDSRIEAAKTDLQGKIDAVDELADQGIADAAAAQSTADSASAQAATNATNIGNLQTDVAGLKTADTQMQGRLDALEEAVGDGDVDSKIAALRKEILTDGAVGDGISDAYDTIQEIAEWLGDNELNKTAGDIITDINTNLESINGLKNLVGTGTVDSRIETAKSELQGKIDAVDELADKGIADAAAAQSTANSASSQAATNAANIATNLESINGLKNLVGTSTVDSRIESAKSELQGKIDAVDELADQGIADAAAAQSTADEAKAQANTNKTAIENHTTTINGHTTDIQSLVDALTWGTFN